METERGECKNRERRFFFSCRSPMFTSEGWQPSPGANQRLRAPGTESNPRPYGARGICRPLSRHMWLLTKKRSGEGGGLGGGFGGGAGLSTAVPFDRANLISARRSSSTLYQPWLLSGGQRHYAKCASSFYCLNLSHSVVPPPAPPCPPTSTQKGQETCPGCLFGVD